VSYHVREARSKEVNLVKKKNSKYQVTSSNEERGKKTPTKARLVGGEGGSDGAAVFFALAAS